jgi:hypothetical protein
MQVKRNKAEKATFIFWTALGPISHHIAAGLHRKYPTLTFVFMGCDEFEYPMTLQWSVKPGDERNLEHQAKVIAISNQFQFQSFLAVRSGITKPELL